MNLEDLIAKYLDGELSQAEDDHLRAQISLDKNARAKFDSAVMVHIAVKEDANSIFPPLELIRDTEDKILMKILSNQPIINETPAKPIHLRRRFAVLALAVFAFTIFNISDSFVDISNLTTIISKLPTSNANPEFIDEVSNDFDAVSQNFNNNLNNKIIKKLNNKIIKKAPFHLESQTISANVPLTDNSDSPVLIEESIILYPESADKNEVSSNDLFADNNNNSPQPENRIVYSELISNENNNVNENVSIDGLNSQIGTNSVSIVNSLNYFELPDSKSQTIYDPSDVVNLNNLIDMAGGKSDIELTSFFGTNMIGSSLGTDQTAISHFSQSISYSTSDLESFGLEFGYTQFDLLVTNQINIPVFIGNGNSSSNPADGSGAHYIRVPVEQEYNLQQFWGSAFYERNLIDYGDFNLKTRLGAGFSSEGPLFFTRLYARYELVSSVAITLGAEGRYFESGISDRINSNAYGYLSSFSLVYGLQFKF